MWVCLNGNIFWWHIFCLCDCVIWFIIKHRLLLFFLYCLNHYVAQLMQDTCNKYMNTHTNKLDCHQTNSRLFSLTFCCCILSLQDSVDEQEKEKMREASKRLYAQLQDAEKKHQEDREQLLVSHFHFLAFVSFIVYKDSNVINHI